MAASVICCFTIGYFNLQFHFMEHCLTFVFNFLVQTTRQKGIIMKFIPYIMLLLVLHSATVLQAASLIPDDYVLYYNMDNGQVVDASVNGLNPQTIQNISTTTDRHGQSNGAIRFNGSTSKIEGPNETAVFSARPPLVYAAFLWVNFYTDGYTTFLNTNESSGYDDYYQISFASSNRVLSAGWRYRSGGHVSDDLILVNSSDFQLNRWYHLGVIFDQTSESMLGYVDGQYAGSIYVPSWPDFVENKHLMIGASEWNGYDPHGVLNGAMDDLYIYDRVLNQTEINALFTQSNQPNDDTDPQPIPAPLAAVAMGVLGMCGMMRRRRQVQ